MAHDEKAEELERAGLWRRAARRWLEVMDICSDTRVKEYIMIRRNQCLAIASEDIPRLKRQLERRYYMLWGRNDNF